MTGGAKMMEFVGVRGNGRHCAIPGRADGRYPLQFHGDCNILKAREAERVKNTKQGMK